jgi:hypothetical protein
VRLAEEHRHAQRLGDLAVQRHLLTAPEAGRNPVGTLTWWLVPAGVWTRKVSPAC